MTTPSHARLALRDQHPLGVLFAPESVAVFGATDKPGSVGRTLMSNLIRSPFGGLLFPIHPRHRAVHGIEAYPNLAAVPTPVEVAIVGTPAPTIPGILDECRTAGVKAAIVLSGGFGESGSAGIELEHRIREGLQRGSMRVVGPNSIGIACPPTGFNATFIPALVPSGKIGFLSQSGALVTALFHQEAPARLGCSAFVSVGSLLDIGWAEWLHYLAADPETECIGIYMEQPGDARSFFAAAREVALQKPILLIRGGKRVPEGPAYDEVFEEACRCSGVVNVHRFADLLRVADHLTSRPAAQGPRLAIVTNARGPAVLASDGLRSGGGSLAALAPETITELSGVLPPRWDRHNPIDVGDDANASRFARAADIAARDPNADALLVLLAPQAAIDPVQVAERLRALARNCAKPILSCWMWGAAQEASLSVLRDAGIATFHSPEAAVRTFGYLWRHAEALHSLGTIRAALAEANEEAVVDRSGAEAVHAAASRAGRTVLTDVEARQLLAAYGLPAQEQCLVGGEAEAIQAADLCGYPVLVELNDGSEDPTQDCQVVRLKAADAGALCHAMETLRLVVRAQFGAEALGLMTIRQSVPSAALEVAVSVATDPDLGGVIRLGASPLARATRQAVTALAPLTSETARKMIEQSLVQQAVGARHSDETNALERFLLRLSQLAVEQPWIKEITINSLLVWERQALARDAHIALHEQF